MAGLSPTKSNNQPLCTVKLHCKDNRPYVIELEGVFIFHLKSNFFFPHVCAAEDYLVVVVQIIQNTTSISKYKFTNLIVNALSRDTWSSWKETWQ